MNESQKDFRQQLLQAQAFNPALKEKYEKEVQAMLEQRLTGLKRWARIGTVTMGAGFGLLFGAVAMAILVPIRGFSIWGRIGFVAGGIFALAFAGLLGWIAKKGRLNLKRHPKAMAGMAWGFVVIMFTLFLLLAQALLGGRHPDSVRSVFMVVSGLVFCIFGAVALISVRVGEAQLKSQEKLLEIEYRLAQIAEEMAKKEQK